MDAFLTKETYAKAYALQEPFYIDIENHKSNEFISYLPEALLSYFQCYLYDKEGNCTISKEQLKNIPVLMIEYDQKKISNIITTGLYKIYYLRDSFEIRKLHNYEKQYLPLSKTFHDNYSPHIIKYCGIHIIKKLKNFVEDRGGEFILCAQGALANVNNKSKYEVQLLSTTNILTEEEKNNILRQYGEKNVCTAKNHLFPIIKNGVYCNQEIMTPEHISTKNNYRVTTDQPEHYTNTIFILGTSTTYGYGVADDETLTSHLQRIINKKYNIDATDDGPVYKVESRATGFEILLKQINIIKSLPIRQGDIIILCMQCVPNNLSREHEVKLGLEVLEKSFATQYIPPFQDFISAVENSGIACIHAYKAFDRPHAYGEVFFDGMHLAPNGQKVMASIIFDYLKERLFEKRYAEEIEKMSSMFIEDHMLFANSFNLNTSQINSFYIKELREKAPKPQAGSVTGAIVMNCNPFTLGHKYLIEYACSNVDKLYIFVVEENLSDFSFSDRFSLVQAGIADINADITVLPSGTLISRKSFPGYFGLYDFISPEIDIENFAIHIAPIFSITKRFAGKEPLSPKTEEYNRFMEKILPRYGIEFIEIERARIGDSVISASRVRKAFAEGDRELLKQLVPPSTFSYLQEKLDLRAAKSSEEAVQ